MEEPACECLSQCPAPAVAAGEAQLCDQAGSGATSEPLQVQGRAAWDFFDIFGVEFSLLSKISNCKQSLKQQINYFKS